mgnify:CR=1 FL=1
MRYKQLIDVYLLMILYRFLVLLSGKPPRVETLAVLITIMLTVLYVCAAFS